MNRYNIFYQVHKGLRALLYSTANLLQQTDFLNEDESSVAVAQVKEVLNLFEGHAHAEDHFVLPAIEVYEPSAAAMFEEEHVLDHELGGRLLSLIHIFTGTEYPDGQLLAAGALRAAFTEFMIFNLQHMAKEESKLNTLLWKYFSDEELKAITQRIVAAIPQEKMMRFSTWMMRGLSNSEIRNWLVEIKNNAPEFVFQSMLALAEKELPANRWEAVQGGITEGALLA